MSQFCCFDYPDGTGFNTMGSSVFNAASKALKWVEIDRRLFGLARLLRDDERLVIGVGMVPDRW